MLQKVSNMMINGYDVKEICISNDIFGGKEINDIEIYSDYVCIDLIYKEVLVADISKIEWIVLTKEWKYD